MRDKQFIREMNGLHCISHASLGSRKFNRLMNEGVLVAFADGLLYNNNAYLFVGMPRSGKTTLVRMFNNYNRNSTILSEDSTTISIDNRLLVYETAKSPHADLNPVISNGISYTLSKIISLDNNSSMDNVLLRMFSLNSTGDVNPIKRYFNDVPLIHLPKQKSVRDRYSHLKHVLMDYNN